ncbi:hypothetical protein [Spirosoma harenae]
MRQRLNPWAVVITAAITFGSLMAFVGPRSYGYHGLEHYGWERHGHYGHQHRYHHGDCDSRKSDRTNERADTSSFQ